MINLEKTNNEGESKTDRDRKQDIYREGVHEKERTSDGWDNR